MQTADLQPTTNPANFNTGIASPTNVYTTNAAYAVCTDVSSTSTVSGFGNFAIPAAAVITGIQVDVIGHYTGSGVNHSINTKLAGTSGVFTAGKSASLHLTTDTTITLGTGTTDLWGTTWTPSDFANNTFQLKWGGSSISVTNMNIDSFTVRVFYVVQNGNILLMFRP